MNGSPPKRRSKEVTWRSRPLNIQKLGKGTLAERLAKAIRGRILLGDVKAGQRLESNRELAAQAGVSVSTVREAISELRADGMVLIRGGVGTFVASGRRTIRAGRAARRRVSPAEAADLRWAVEPAVAETAANRASGRQLQELRFRLGERWLGRVSGDPDRFLTTDLRFHDAVAQAARNALGVASLRLAAGIAKDDLRVHASDLVQHPELDGLHSALVDAVAAHSPRRAGRLARQIAEIESGGGAGGP
jgi:GntR family transcriptional regulator, transcriptional repressor for pyruvate dehydrogenase complex